MLYLRYIKVKKEYAGPFRVQNMERMKKEKKKKMKKAKLVWKRVLNKKIFRNKAIGGAAAQILKSIYFGVLSDRAKSGVFE